MLQPLQDETYMRLALQMAQSAQGQTGVNPVVGCVLVKDGRVVGMGAHLRRGEGHAEVLALQMAGAEAAGATAYVTLEPCSHYGRTPPCSDRLIQSGVRRVVVASVDPNPLVAGSGIARLKSSGIRVDAGLLAEEANALNEAFNKFIVTRLPFVTMKNASTLDGKIAARTGDSKWITGAPARELVHTMRHRHAAIMVGIGTVLADDPELTTRLAVPALHPLRVVVDSQLRTPLSARVLPGQDGGPTLILTTAGAPASRREALEAHGARVLTCGSGPHVDLPLAMRLLGEMEIPSVLLEGGGRLSGAMLESRLVDKAVLFFAPKWIGGGAQAPDNVSFGGFGRMSEAIRLARMTVQTVGDDVCLTGYPQYAEEEASSCLPE
ncbi:bifunctional diaminohydroxyphosphoribosylaminopyrimidine deaminase/5-amino-6-(5-phosphoribosylamino)uracil reductase RibD [Paenibacillus lutrae]|uniref:Riboflavin biosynthesis protein RibD n=1 Tax=Paenibacillus lutrae TaxID=2078573 RepID=A0A7X3FIG4_9BACL|nr:bifunctional diaminohydroxyphosphoribosylaminopyrimidine deaminase/5-amino-6-(5-phosphoribosylamino)uracil reductase RibD [Paenibacillus lutrae]MVP00094.1 bifunctional diaminohydroxyphosphoribosylaminopyrimidine deaminase/5-amino-6-(5-phosphoribosylamino)uracil reductase RibD [Paenibacillus lutrae]